MSHVKMLEESKHHAQEVFSRLYGISVENDDKSRVALACYGIAQQHHAAIILLLDQHHPLLSSALSLLRSLYEATFRGAWVGHCATDEQAANLVSGDKKQVDMASIISVLLRELQSTENADFYKKAWPALSACTHTYEHQLLPWLTEQDITPTYQSGQIEWVLKRATEALNIIEAGVRFHEATPQSSKS